MVSLVLSWTNSWVNSQVSGDLRRSCDETVTMRLLMFMNYSCIVRSALDFYRGHCTSIGPLNLLRGHNRSLKRGRVEATPLWWWFEGPWSTDAGRVVAAATLTERSWPLANRWASSPHRSRNGYSGCIVCLSSVPLVSFMVAWGRHKGRGSTWRAG